MSENTLNVAQLIDERHMTKFNILVTVLSFCCIFFDGYDISCIPFAVPYMVKAWHITDMRLLGPVFSASLFGMLFGAPVFGYVGDRWGRKAALISSCCTFGLFTLIAAWSTGISQLMIMRAIAGVGLGGLFPNLIALNGEYAPRRHRAKMIIIFFLGSTLGGSSPGFVSVWLAPRFGWQMLFYIGGIAPIVMSIILAFFMPESIKFLVVHKQYRARAVKMIKRLMPNIEIGPNTELVMPAEKAYTGFKPKMLFSDGMAKITTLLWLCFVMNLMGYYFILNWIPTLLTARHVLTMSDAAIATSLIQVFGTIGGLLISKPMETKGFYPVACMFTLAIPCVVMIGHAGSMTRFWAIATISAAGFCIMGLQFGLNAASAMIYPTAYRANASGWCFGVARFGSVAGPIIGGFLIAAHFSLKSLFAFGAIPFVVGTISCWTLSVLYVRTFKGVGLGERQAAAQPQPVAETASV